MLVCLQVVRHERASIKADIWSYGILIWELISGQDITELQPLAIARQAQRKVCRPLNHIDSCGFCEFQLWAGHHRAAAPGHRTTGPAQAVACFYFCKDLAS